jgi:hypothetical protein
MDSTAVFLSAFVSPQLIRPVGHRLSTACFGPFFHLVRASLSALASYRVKQNFLSHPQTVYKLSTGECSKHMTPVPCLSVTKVRPRHDGVDKKRLFVSVPQISLIDPRALNESV